MPLTNGAKFAGYTIERQLGSGGMGEVYLVQHPRLPRHDALKVLRSDVSADPDFLERFNREADLAAKLWHPHIVGIHDRGTFRGRVWISMDFVDGTDVSRLLQDSYPDGMPRRDALDVINAVAAALDYAHGRGLLHRDVKPANILVADVDNGERRILLGDFGVARDLADNASGGLTATNMTVGTAAYAAPEQLMGLAVDGRTDQYSLAATAHHLLTGAPPFIHTNPAVVIGQHLNAAPPSLAGSRPELASLDAALSRALAKDPADRFGSCMDFARALGEPATTPVLPTAAPSPSDADTMLRDVTSAPAPSSVASMSVQPPSGPNRTIWFALAAAAAIAVIVVVAYFALQPSTTELPAAPFTIAGTLRLSGDVVKTSGLPGGYKCAGTRDFGDVGPNAPVTVEDESGKLLAKGAIDASSSGSDGCSLKFSVADVPAGAHFYRVKVAQHPETSYTEAEAKAGIDYLMSNTDSGPTTATAAPSSKPVPWSTPARTFTPTFDVETASLNRLRQIANDDRSDVLASMTDTWIPQISSKKVGLRAEGTEWDNDQIRNEHLRLRRIYPDVKLLWSGDWSTYDGRDFWVTVVGLHADNPDAVLNWCTQQGFDRDHCIAKVVSTSLPIAGSTRMLSLSFADQKRWHQLVQCGRPTMNEDRGQRTHIREGSRAGRPRGAARLRRAGGYRDGLDRDRSLEPVRWVVLTDVAHT
jgi:serine/threonine protein kinase